MAFKSTPKSGSASSMIFSTPAVAAHLAAVHAAGDAAGEAKWWAPVLRFDLSTVRKGNQGTNWCTVYYTDEAGVSAPLKLRVRDECHSGMIMPNTEAGLAELTAAAKNPKFAFSMRTYKPTLQIKKWSVPVQTGPDGFELLHDADGQPILPGDDTLSVYYQVAEHVSDAFVKEMEERINRGHTMVAKLVEVKNRPAPKATAAEYIAAWGAHPPNSVIIADTDINGRLKGLITPDRMPGLLQVAMVQVWPLVQTVVGPESKRKADIGKTLANPVTRPGLSFDLTTGAAITAFYDKSAPYIVDGKQKYEAGKVGDAPVTNDNVHKFVISGVRFDGVIDMSTVCFSKAGASMPTKSIILVVAPRASTKLDLDDLYGDEDAELVGEVRSALPAKTAKVPAATAAAPAAEEATEADYANLLGGLSA